jgi:quinol monooxygenase YgiN
MPGDTHGKSEIITYVGTLTIKPENDEEFVALVTATAKMVRSHEPGTLLHAVHRHPTEPHTFVDVERYLNADAVKTHAEAPYFQETMGKVQNWLAKPPEVLQLTQIVSDVDRVM